MYEQKRKNPPKKYIYLSGRLARGPVELASPQHMDKQGQAPLYSHLPGRLARGPGELASPQHMVMQVIAFFYSHLPGRLARGPGELASPKHMDMKVVHGLASLYAIVDHNPRNCIFTVKIRTKRQPHQNFRTSYDFPIPQKIVEKC